jgi:hypothetical protein
LRQAGGRRDQPFRGWLPETEEHWRHNPEA